jgi:hypothetical protein
MRRQSAWDDNGDNNDYYDVHVRPTGSDRIGRIDGPAGIHEDGTRGKGHGRRPNEGRRRVEGGQHRLIKTNRGGDVHGTMGRTGIARDQ